MRRREALDAWQKNFSDQSVSEILRYRDDRKLSNDELRGRLAKLGWDLTKDSLASILAAKRKSMPITDLILFAQALNIPAVALIFPIWTNQDVQLAPADDKRLNSYEAARWLAGKNPHVATPFLSDVVTDHYYEVGDIVSRIEEIDEMLHTVDALHWNMQRDFAAGEGIDEAKKKEFGELLGDVAYLRNFLRKVYRGINLPPMRPALEFIDEREWTLPQLPIPSYDNEWEAAFHARMDASEARHAAPSDADK